jgi:hypothetical protein
MTGNLPLLVRWLTTVGIIPKSAVAQLEPHSAPRGEAVLDAGRLAERTYATLDALGKNVVLISRAGQNLAQFGMRYSHMGIAVKNLKGRDWGLVHLLTRADDGRSAIYLEGLVNFFSDNPFEMACMINTLPPEVEDALFNKWSALATALHCPSYSLTSYPWSLSTQNSNQWLLETLAMATVAGNGTRDSTQEWLKEQGYAPSCLEVSLPVQWFAPLLRDSIKFDDQPTSSRRDGKIYTVTVDSIRQFLETAPAYEHSRNGLKTIEISL